MSDGSDADASLTAEKVVLDFGGDPGDLRILRKSSKQKQNKKEIKNIMSTATMAYRRNTNTVHHQRLFNLGAYQKYAILVLLIAGLSILYINQVTKLDLFNYQAANLEKELEQLKGENQLYQVEATRLQSIQVIKESKVANEMVPADPQFIKS